MPHKYTHKIQVRLCVYLKRRTKPTVNFPEWASPGLMCPWTSIVRSEVPLREHHQVWGAPERAQLVISSSKVSVYLTVWLWLWLMAACMTHTLLVVKFTHTHVVTEWHLFMRISRQLCKIHIYILYVYETSISMHNLYSSTIISKYFSKSQLQTTALTIFCDLIKDMHTTDFKYNCCQSRSFLHRHFNMSRIQNFLIHVISFSSLKPTTVQTMLSV